jgi:hypothetical protein
MRLTVNLDDEVYAVARSLARAEDISIGEAINRLIRKGLERPVRLRRSRRGFPIMQGRHPFGADDVAKLEDPE